MAPTERWMHYAILIQSKIVELFSEEYGQMIDLKQLDSEDELQAFFHALMTVVPCEIFNKIIGDNKNHLEMNHLANKLCMKYMKVS